MNYTYFEMYKKCKNIDKYLKQLNYSYYYKTTPEEIEDNKIKIYLIKRDYDKCIKILNEYENYLIKDQPVFK